MDPLDIEKEWHMHDIFNKKKDNPSIESYESDEDLFSKKLRELEEKNRLKELEKEKIDLNNINEEEWEEVK